MTDRLADSLPLGFDFYHLGRVDIEDGAAAGHASEQSQAFAFHFEGEARGVLAVVFEDGIDSSAYSELGNVIASQMATSLSQSHGLEVSISPPRPLTPAQLKVLLGAGTSRARSYLHRHEGRAVPFQAVVISSEEVGNA